VGTDGVPTVMDWEFCFGGWPLLDVGMMLRYEDHLGPSFARSFELGLCEAA